MIHKLLFFKSFYSSFIFYNFTIDYLLNTDSFNFKLWCFYEAFLKINYIFYSIDPMFRGIYNGSRKHVDDLHEVLRRAVANGVEKVK